MKLFALAVNNEKEVTFSGDLTLHEAKSIIEMVLYQQAFEAGKKSVEEVKEAQNESSKE